MRWLRRLALVGLGMLGMAGRHGTAAPDDPARAIARAEELLGDPDRGVRYAAVVSLGKGGAAPDVVARGLRDPERCVRYEAAWWLRRAGAAAWPTLDGALVDPAPPVRAAAAWALSSFGAEAVPRLRRALDDADPETVLEAVAATRRLGRDLAKPLLDGIRAKAVAAHAEPMPEVDDDMDPPTVARIAAAAAALKEKRRELDATLAVLDPPPPKVEPPAPAAPPAGPTAAEPVPGDAPPEPPRPPDPALAEPALAMPTIDRVDAVLGLGAGPDDLAALERALADPDRDVRIAAVSRSTARGDVVPRLVRGLDDRTRGCAARMRALGRRGAAPDRTARFLDDPSLPTSSEARRALTTAGGAGAAAAAERMRAGGYAALHHGLLLFEELGAGGAPAVPTLAAMLADADPNVREIAARCLFHVGRGAAPAAPALLAALGDRRLCVIAHAALALGRIGLTEPLLAATAAPSARVRAYAAWAVAWALGEARAVDQVAYEARLPVLDVGATGPFPTAEEVHEVVTPAWRTHDDDEAAAARAEAVRLERLRRAIWAKDPAIAVVAAAALKADDVDVVEAERVMELVLPEGVRDGSPVEFGSLRRLVGTNEVPACVVYAARMRATSDARSSIYGNFHRMSRAEMLPFLAWFDRVEPGLEHVGELCNRRPDAALCARADGWRAPDDVPAAGDGDLPAAPCATASRTRPSGSARGTLARAQFTPRPACAVLLVCARKIVERAKWSHTSMRTPGSCSGRSAASGTTRPSSS
jgi:HEAT repeat protein